MIGLMRHRVSIRRENKLDNGRGGWTVSEIVIGEVWAAIFPMTHREIQQHRQLGSQIDTRIVMYHRDDIDTTCRLYTTTHQYKIEQLQDHVGFSDYIEILAIGDEING